MKNKLLDVVVFKKLNNKKYVMSLDSNVLTGMVNDMIGMFCDNPNSDYAPSVLHVLESAISARLVTDAFMSLHSEDVKKYDHVSITFNDSLGPRVVNISANATETLGGIVYGLQR